MLRSPGDTERTRSDTRRKYNLDKQSLILWTFPVTLTLNAVIPFFHRTLRLKMLYYQTKFGCKPTSSLEDTTEIAIFWLYKPSLWPWHWTQWANFTAWHPGLWCCIIIPGLATKCSVVQKISSEQTFTISLNLRCDLDLESNNPIFHRTLRLLMVCYQTNFGCKRTSNLEDIVKKKIVIFWLYTPSLWPRHWR